MSAAICGAWAVQGEVPHGQQADLRVRQVAPERLRARRHEHLVALAPDGEQRQADEPGRAGAIRHMILVEHGVDLLAPLRRAFGQREGALFLHAHLSWGERP
ncbi:hypothetical protein [Streptomyces solicamelliae]|uniref:hypothetical protein n=1 Tax=Streptomyces solicamelliae TaxID=3231716 RepID=UPI00387796E7